MHFDFIFFFRFNENDRPVQLQRFVYGYMDTGNSFQFGIRLTFELTKIVNRLLNEISAEKKILVKSRRLVADTFINLSVYLNFIFTDLLPYTKRYRNVTETITNRCQATNYGQSKRIATKGIRKVRNENIELIQRKKHIKQLLFLLQNKR